MCPWRNILLKYDVNSQPHVVTIPVPSHLIMSFWGRANTVGILGSTCFHVRVKVTHVLISVIKESCESGCYAAVQVGSQEHNFEISISGNSPPDHGLKMTKHLCL